MILLRKTLIINLVWLLLIGCNKDNANAPGITLSGNKLVDGVVDAAENETVNIKINVDAPGGFQLLRISFSGIVRDVEEIKPAEPGLVTFETNYEFKNWSYVDAPFEIIFTAIDNENSSSLAKVIIQPGLPGIQLLESNDVENDTLFAFTGQLWTLNYRYTFPAGFNQFQSLFFVDGQKETETLVTTLPPTQGTSVTDQINQVFGAEFLGKELHYTFEVVDKFGEKASLMLPVLLDTKPTAKFEAVKLFPPASDGSQSSFFSSNTGVVYSPDEVNITPEFSQFIDFGYYHDVTDNSSFTGPANFPTNIYNVGPNGDDWSPLNVTNFKRTDITVSEFNGFDENSQDDIDDAYSNASGGVLLVITNLVIDEVVSFKTSSTKPSGTKFGLFRVVSIVPGGPGVGSITIEVIANQ